MMKTIAQGLLEMKKIVRIFIVCDNLFYQFFTEYHIFNEWLNVEFRHK